jgi:succinate dehydrogenase flavin-adding protein (antitoxin of CptAB toxin-antitoxin module)
MYKYKKVKINHPYLPDPEKIPADYLLWRGSSETDNLFLPFARRAFKTLRPLAVDILSRKPCLFFLFLFDG